MNSKLNLILISSKTCVCFHHLNDLTLIIAKLVLFECSEFFEYIHSSYPVSRIFHSRSFIDEIQKPT